MLKAMCTTLLLLFTTCVIATPSGQAAPNIFGRHINGDLYVLSKQAAKPRVINFFWVDCVPCRKEIPLLAQKARQYPQVDFVVVHAEMNPQTDTNYDISHIQDFVATLTAYPANVVLGNARLKEPKAYNIPAFPLSVLVNKHGIIEQRLVGFNDATVTKLSHWLAQQ